MIYSLMDYSIFKIVHTVDSFPNCWRYQPGL